MAKQSFRDSEVFLLHEIVTRLDRLARVRILEREDVTYPEFLVLMAIREMGTPAQVDVGGLLDMSKSLVSQRVLALLKKGLVVQSPDPQSRRHVRLALTDGGRTTIDRIYAAMIKRSSTCFEKLGRSHPAFVDALQGLRTMLVHEEESEGTLNGPGPSANTIKEGVRIDLGSPSRSR